MSHQPLSIYLRENLGGSRIAARIFSIGHVSVRCCADGVDAFLKKYPEVVDYAEMHKELDVIPDGLYSITSKTTEVGFLAFFGDSEGAISCIVNTDRDADSVLSLILYITKNAFEKDNLVVIQSNNDHMVSIGGCSIRPSSSSHTEGMDLYEYSEKAFSNPDYREYCVEQYILSEYLKYSIDHYSYDERSEWDNFVQKSINGTFLQSQQFLEYHPEGRFKDDSLMIRKSGKLCALVPGVDCVIDSLRTFYSHRGSTFGGIIVCEDHYDIESIKYMIKAFEDYVYGCGYKKVILKNTSSLFCKIPTDLISYYMFKNGFSSYSELSFYIDCADISSDPVESFSRHKRKHYKESLRHDLEYRQFDSDDEVVCFYHILEKNLKIHERAPTHSLEEMLDLYHNRLSDRIRFYGVYYEGKMIAGTMMFIFSDNLIHTQYIATDYDYAFTYCTYFLYGQMISGVKDMGYSVLSFGISTEECGQYLNEGLASLKEGFGSKYLVNQSYFKIL